MRRLLLLAFAIALGARAVDATTLSSCPACTVGSVGSSEFCVQAYDGNSWAGIVSRSYRGAMCVGCSNNTINCDAVRESGLTSPPTGTRCATQTQLDMSTAHCGRCGNNCLTNTTGGGPECVTGSCRCSVGSYQALCGKGKYCEATTTKCALCPTGTTTCTGDAGSYGISPGNVTLACLDLNVTRAHCGKCNNNCAAVNGDSCVEGQCKCGSGPACGVGRACNAGVCAPVPNACVIGSPSFRCGLVEFCTLNATLNATVCAQCPTGFAQSFSPTVRPTYNGQPSDCDFNLLSQQGNSTNCGYPGRTARYVGAPASLTCCSGVPKCGTFADVNAPSETECTVARKCGETEFCDGVTGTCQGLGFTTRRNCNGFAGASADYSNTQDMSSGGFCGSCNKSLNWVGDKCYMFDRDNCGAPDNKCKGLLSSYYQSCYYGKCTCITGGLVTYNPWFDVVAKPRFKLSGLAYQTNPACNIMAALIPSGWFAFVGRQVNAFAACAADSGIASFNLTEFANPQFRARACPGGPFNCNASFCDDIYANVTKYRDDVCSQADFAKSGLEMCVQATAYSYNSSLPAETDRTCASKWSMLNLCFGSSGQSADYDYNTIATFLNCSMVQGAGNVTRISTAGPTFSTSVTTACWAMYKNYPDAGITASASWWVAAVASAIAVAVFVAV